MKIKNQINGDLKYNQIMLYLLIASIAMIAIDNLPYFSGVLGELGFKGSIYPFLIIIPIIMLNLIRNRTIYIWNEIEYKILYFFIGWVGLSSLLNIKGIIMEEFKGRSGVNKFFLQMMVLIFLFIITYCTEILKQANKITLWDLRKYIFISTIPVMIYGTFEILHLLKIIDFTKILEILSQIFQTYYRGEVYTKGIRTICGEVSYFAMYAGFAIPWIVSYLFTEKEKNKKIKYAAAVVYLIVFIALSKSRTAYGILMIQLVVFSLFLFVMKIDVKIKKQMVMYCLIAILGVSIMNMTVLRKYTGDVNSVNKINIIDLVKSLSDKANMSNVARFGMMKGTVEVGQDNFIYGVGIGQNGFYIKDKLDEQALKSDEVQMWIAEDNSAWPPAFSLYPRIFAEQGIIGIGIFLILIAVILFRSINKLRKRENDFLGIALIVSFIGTLLAWINADSFAQVSFWIIVPFIIGYNNQKVEEGKEI